MLEEFQRIGRLMFAERLIGSHGANLSVRKGDKVFITRTGAMLADLKAEDIVEVELGSAEVDKGISPELPTHLAVYKNSKALAIIHAHPATAIALSITDNKIVPQDAEGLHFYKAAPIVRVRDGVGSEETVRLLPNFLGDNNVIAVVKAHGSFAVGQTLEEAYKYTSLLENSCRIIVAIRSSGSRGTAEEKRPSRPNSRPAGNRRDYKSAIPPGIGVMDRSRYHKR
ncbi:MAG: class II aldolase/adducin family protein [bacterium]